MSCLVHPTGWRLYHRRFWNSTIYIDKKYQPPLNFISKVMFEIIYNLFSRVKYRLRHKSFFGFSGFNITMGNGRNINIYVHFKMYWRTYYTETSVAVHKVNKQSLKFLNKPWGPRQLQPNFWVLKRFGKRNRLTEDRVTCLFNQRLIYYLRKRKYHKGKRRRRRLKLKTLPLRTFENQTAHFFIKKFFIYFTLLPLFYQYKAYLLKSIKSQIPSNNFKFNIFFIGRSLNYFNPMDVLRFVSFLLYKKRFSPTKTFYSILRVMLRLKDKFKLRGFKFLLAGRFTRRGRSIYKWRTFGGVNLSSKYSSVEFYSFPLQGHYSKCIAKLWVCRA